MNKHTLAAGIAALATSLSAAYGATITDSATFSGLAVGSPISFIALNKFNSGLGTLTQIQLLLETTTTNSALVFDNESFTIPPFTPGSIGGPSSTITLALGTQITASTGVSLPTIVTANSTTTRTGPITNDTDLPGPGNPTGAPNFLGIDSLGLLPSTTVNSSASTVPPLTTASYLAQFTASPGATSYLVAISSLFSNPGSLTSNPTGLAGAFNTASQNFSGKVTAIYTFTPVPEASTILFGAALGLGFAFRRFRTQLA